MAISYFNRPDFGSSAAQSLGTGLEALAKLKIDQLQKRQQVAKYKPLYESMGFDEKTSQAFADQPVENQREFIKSIFQSGSPLVSLSVGGQAPEQTKQPSALTPQQGLQQGVLQVTQPQSEEAKGTSLQQFLHGKAKNVAIAEQKEKEKIQRIEQARIDKETQKYYEILGKEERGAEASDRVLNRMEELISKKGGLPVGSFYNLFKNLEEKVSPTTGGGVGGVLGAYLGGPAGAIAGSVLGGAIGPIAGLLRSAQKFTSPNTEEFEQLSTGFVQNIKNIFGSQISEQELKTFLQTIPNLAQTDAGKKAIIQNTRAINDAIHLRNKVANDIIDKNGGKRPENFEYLVEQESAQGLKQIASKMELGYSRLYDLGVGDTVKTKLPPPSSAVIGSQLSYKGKKYVNAATPYGPQWQLVFNT